MSDAYKIFRQLQERKKETQQYKSYEKEDLIDEIINLQQENQQLKEEKEKIKIAITENCDLRLEVLKYKEVIEEVREYIEKECNDLLIGYFHNRFDTTEYYEKLLQILDKAKENK